VTVETDWRHYDPAALPRVLAAALEAFADQGYHGTSIRDIAAEAGLSVPGLYHHYRSKQDILMDLMMSVMEELLARSRMALQDADPSAEAQFDALVESLLRFHMFRRKQAFVASSEIRSLAPENRTAYVALRDEQQRMIEAVIARGRSEGAFATPFPQDAARAVSTLCVGVASWYREDGALTPREIVERHLALAHGLVAARPAAP